MQRTSWRVALLVVVALLGAACGRGGNDAEEDPGDAAPAEADEELTGAEDEPPTTPEPESVTYEVQDGDTLSSIAIEHDVSIDAIVAANDLDDPDAIYPGDVLEIPDRQAAAPGDDGAGNTAGDGAAEDGDGSAAGED